MIGECRQRSFDHPRVGSEFGSGRPTSYVSFDITGGSRFAQPSSVKGQPMLKLIYSYVASTPVLIVGASLAIGYFLGSTSRSTVVPAEEDDGDDPTNVCEDTDGDLSAITPGLMEPCKMVRFTSSPPLSANNILQVLVVRADLKMTNGKIAAQWVTSRFSHYPA